MLRLVPAFVLLMLTNAAAGAELGHEFAKAFIGSCLQMLPRTDRIEAAARALDFQPIEGDMAQMFAPTEPDAKWQAWLVDQAPAPPFFLFISEGEFDGALQKICGVTNPYAPESEVVPYLLDVLGLEDPMHTDVSAGQRMRLWQTEVNGESSIITVTDATPMGEVGISLSGMMKADE